MRIRKIVSILVVTVMVLLSIAACGTEPVSMSDIPVYPGAQPMQPGEHELADDMADVIKQSAGGEGITAEISLYSLPAEAAWEDVKNFYSDKMAGLDWDSEEDLTEDTEFFSSLGWSRGRGASEQALVVGYVADILGSGAFLIVGLFSE